MKKKRLKRLLTWIGTFLLTIILGLGLLFIAKPDMVKAVLSFRHVVSLFARVNIEIMLPTAYGRYYNDLYWENFDELWQIARENQEVRENINSLMALYIPHIEATLDGRGDEVTITQSQVDQLQALFDELMALSNGELHNDIARELERTPLQDFVGMSMNETLAHIESTWERDFSDQPVSTEMEVLTETVPLEP
ncbi:MAG: hypothetical protein JEZ00_20710 [Anaerolineaceae bacterium]|nr:hypothetical protein [Anaerolineaceae bacterium]